MHKLILYSKRMLLISALGLSSILPAQTTVNFTVNQPQLPEADFGFEFKTSNVEVEFMDSSRAYGDSITDYVWDLGDGNLGTTPNFTHTYLQPGIYNVCLAIRVDNFCKDTICKEVSSFVGIGSNQPAIEKLSISPNPFNELVNISFETDRRQYLNVSVYNLIGEKLVTLLDGEMEAGLKTLKFDANKVGSGAQVFFVNITVGDQVYTEKIIRKQ